MVAIVSGNSLGLELTSLGVLGSQGAWGTAGQGADGEQVYVNAATGNLVIQRRDDFLASHGLNNEALRTYNSLGLLTDDNADNWSLGVYAQQMLLTGTVNTAGSTLTRTARDGSQSTYTWDATQGCYVSKQGGGAHDTITYDSTYLQYRRTDGSSRELEKYSATNGRLLSVTDANGSTSTFTYHATSGMLLSVTDRSGETLTYTYDNGGAGTKLLSISASYKDASGNTVNRSTVSYSYDGSGRLATVTVDLTPDNTADAVVYQTTYTYDGTSTRVKTLTQTDGSALTFSYVQVGSDYRIQSVMDAMGSVTTYSYDTAAKRTTVTDPMQKVWLFDYDAAGQLTKLTSPTLGGVAGSSITQSYQYDADGNLVAMTNGDGETTTMTYDANGNQISITDALGNTVTRTYSSDNHLLTETVSNATTPLLTNEGHIAFDGSDIVKAGGGDRWGDTSFRSSGGLSGPAYVGFKPSQNDKALMVGLNSDPGYNHDWSSLDYAIYCTSGGTLEVRESGSSNKLTSVVTYAAGDDLRVVYDGSKVSYQKNGVTFWTTTVSLATPMYADSAFYHVGARISGLAFGAAPATGSLPLLAESNATVSSNGTVSKTGGQSNVWDASVRSLSGFTGGAMVSFKAGQTNKSLMIGLDSDPAPNDGFGGLDYAFYCQTNGKLCAYEAGVRVEFNPASPSYSTTDTLKVVYNDSLKKVQYLKIDSAGTTTVLREVAVTLTAPLYLDSSFQTAGSQVNELQFGKTSLATVMAAAKESGLSISGDTLTKSGGINGAWDASAHSDVGYVGQASVSFSPAQTNKAFMVGLNTDPTLNMDWTNLDYAFSVRSDGTLEVLEAGSKENKLGAAVSYSAGDKLQISYDGSYVRYYKNGVQLLATAAAITTPLYLDTSFCHVGAQLTDLRFSDKVTPEQTTRYVYSATTPGQLRYTLSAQGRVTQYKYNSYGERTSQIAYADNAYSLTGLGAAQVPTEAQLDNWVSSIGDLSSSIRKDFSYDARGLLAWLNEYVNTNADGTGKDLRQTHYVYDPSGRLLQTIEAASGASGDETGNPITTYTYDGLGRLLTVTDPRGALTSTVYSDGTQKTVVSYQSGATATSTYDKAGRLVSYTRSDSASTSYAYDAAGRLIMTKDPVGVRSYKLYDELGRQVGAVDGSGSLTETTYDKAGRAVRSYTYANLVDLSLLVDANGVALNPSLASVRPATVAADLQSWKVFDDAGRLIYEIAESGAVVQHDYDGLGREVRKLSYSTPIAVIISPSLAYVRTQLSDSDVVAGASLDRSERYFYDADGLLIGSLDAEGYLTQNTYDNAGRKVQTRRYANQVPTAEWAGGGTLGAVAPATSSKDQVETYFYEARGLLTGVVDAEGYLTRTMYGSRGQVVDQTRYATSLGRIPLWTDDFNALLLEIRPGGAYALQPEDRIAYRRYALDGKLVSETNYEGIKTTYEYDVSGRLVKTTQGVGRSDARVTQTRYDAWGRKTADLGGEGSAKITDGLTQSQIDTVWASDGVDYAYDALDRVRSRTDANGNKTLFYYDEDGHLVYTINARGEVEENQYNSRGLLSAVIRHATRISTSGLVGGLATSAVKSLIVADASNDSIVSYGYDGFGRRTSETDATGAITGSYYNLFGDVTSRWVPWSSGPNVNTNKRGENYAYDRRGLLLQTVLNSGGLSITTASEYDAFGRVTKTTDANGEVRSQQFDRLGRIVQTTNPFNKSRYVTFDAFGQQLTVKDELGKITTYTYDRAARSVTVLSPEGVSVKTVRSVYGQVATVVDGNGITTSYTYDEDGNLTQTKVGTTVIDVRAYDVGDRLVASTDALGVRTTYTYDAANRMLTRTVDPTDATDTDAELNLQTKWEFDAKGQAVKVTDSRGIVTEYTFDLLGNTVKQVVDSAGLKLTTDWTYDVEGRVLTVVDPKRVTTKYTYDIVGRRTKEQQDSGGLNLTKSYTYDAAGNVLTSTDARNKVTRYRYDDAGRLTYTVDAEGSVSLNEYDAKGQLVKQTRYVDTITGSEEPNAVDGSKGAQVTRFAYDDDGRLEYTVDALGQVTKNERDGNGNVVKVIRYADTITAGEAPTAVVANSALDQVTRFEYDALNRMTWTADASGAVTRNSFDAAGHLVTRTRFYNKVTEAADPSDVAGSSSDRFDRYVYDAAGRCTYWSDATGAVTGNSYDQNGNLTKVVRYALLAPGVSPDTVVGDSHDRTTNFTYDAAGRKTWEVDSLGFVTQTAYDANGNVTAIRRYADKPDSRLTPSTSVVDDVNDRVQRFEYDNANRLRKSTDALLNTEEYTYDGAGNRLTFKNKNGDVWTYTYDAVGRMLTETAPAVPLYTMALAADGTLTVGGGGSSSVVTTLSYDAFGNLLSRTEATGRPEERTTSYLYDKLNRQIKVTYPPVMVHSETSAELAANTRLDNAARDEVAKTPFTQTWYDVFGNAVSTVDRTGAASFKAYDAAGRVKYEVDALGYVTQYYRNAFGEATGQKRYYQATTLANTPPSDADKGPTTAEIDAAVAADGFATTSDRALWTTYDKAGRVIKVAEPPAYHYNSTSGISVNYAKSITTDYNAFGEVVRVGELADVDLSTDPDTLTYQYTYHYYDWGGRKVATADAAGYLTKFGYDTEGNLTSQLEYSKKMPGTWSVDTYTTPSADSTFDRSISWTWDKLNRKTSETKGNATVFASSTTTSVATSTVSLTTTYGYDAVGNQIWVKDAAGGLTRSYYDALGRVSGVIAPSRTNVIDNSVLTPLVEFRRDAYGNVLVKTERAANPTGVSDAGYTVTVTSGVDRVTKTLFDSAGNAIQMTDAQGFQHFSSYTVEGKLAKNWQTVTDNDGIKKTLYASYYYDKLGCLQNSYAPSPVQGQTVSTNYEYNGFGEIISRGKNGGKQEYFAYDNAGQMWKTNSGDGIATVYLYDLLGRQTSEITNAGSGRSGAPDVNTATSASQADNWANTRRTDTQYDELGHVLQQIGPERQQIEGGVTVRKASANYSVASSSHYSADTGDNGYQSFTWSGTNSVKLTWTTLAYLGSGDVKVDLTYMTLESRVKGYYDDGTMFYRNEYGGSAPVSRKESQIFAGNQGNTGLTLNWTGSDADRGAGIDGISSIARLEVYKRNVNGDWVKVIDRQPGAGRAFGDYGTQVEAGSPVDPSTILTFKYRLSGATDWITASLSKFGDSHWFDASALNGTYEYGVWLTPKDEVAVQTESGTFKTKVDDADDSAQTTNWLRPAVVYGRDRWGNALWQTDPRNDTWKTYYTYNQDNQITSEKRPDPSNGDQTASSPTRKIYYDKLGRQAAVQDERGYVNVTEWDAAGNMVKETHADGGKVTYAVDAFGQVIQMVDAIGNSTADKTNSIYKSHTTRYTYDRMGRRLSTIHGNTDTTGSVTSWHVDVNMNLVNDGKKDLTETFTYDEAGRKLSQVNGASQRTRYWYDLAGNIVKTQQPGGDSSTVAYDAFGNKKSETDANGNQSTWTYDYFGKLTAHKDIGGATYSYSYDAAGQLTLQTNDTRGQHLVYYYDAVGQIIKIGDSTLGEVTTYAYDLAGRHLREKVLRNGQMFQDNHLSYDTLGRLIDSADDRAHLTFQYDAAGNRQKITTHVYVAAVGDDDTETLKNSTRFFQYDAMNRQTVVDAIDANGTINQTQGHVLTYDLNGNRWTDKFWGNKVTATPLSPSKPYYYKYDPDSGDVEYDDAALVYTKTSDFTTETYGYDAYNRLITVDRDGTLVDQRLYDAAGRVVQSGPNGLPSSYSSKLNEGVAPEDQIGMEMRRQRYDVEGQLLYQRVWKSDGTTMKYDIDYEGVGRNNTTLGYDAVGNVLAYEFKNYDGGAYTNTTTFTLAKFEGYSEQKTVTTSTKFSTGTTISTFDANGFLAAVDDTTENTLDKSIVNDAAGRVLRVYQNGNNLWTHIVNGEILGKFGVGPNELDPRTSKNKANFQQVNEFEFGYSTITGSYPAPAVGAYTVRQGDSLQSIAQVALGDSSQWWRVAQANGLQSDRDLRVGQTLTLPSAVSGTTNDSDTFKPYNPSDVVGDTSPNLPQPHHKKGCGGLGQIIMVAVAVVVSYYTAGLAGGGVLGAAVGGAAGSIASQAVGMAIGAQDSFSWKQVAASAVGGAATAGVGTALSGAAPVLDNVVVRAALSNALTQGVSVAAGLQSSFSWKGVAAAAVGAGIGQAINGSLLGDQRVDGSWKMNTDFAQALGGGTTAKIVSGTLAGLASGASVSMMRGGRVSTQQIASDAFGNALGESIKDAMQSTAEPSAADNRAALNKANQAADADYYGSGTADSGVAGGSGITFSRDTVGSWNRRVNAGIAAATSANDWVPASVDASTGSSGSVLPNSEVVASGVDARGLAWTEWSSGATSHAVPPPPVFESSALPSEVQGAGLLASGRASMNDYWSGVADAGVSEGSFLKYLAGRTMQFAGNVGYSLADMGVAVYNNPEQSLAGGLKSIANFGPEAFNGATNLVKTSLNGYSMLAEQLGAGDGAFAGFRGSDAYNITPLFGYDNQAQAGGALLTQAALGVGLAKYGGYGLTFDDIGATGPMASQMGAIKPRLISPLGEPRVSATGNPILTEVEYGTTLDYLIEGAKPSAAGLRVGTHSYENPGHHDPAGGLLPYNPTKSVLPENHIQLFEQSKPVVSGDGTVVRYTLDDAGAVHRFEPTLPGIYHWSGSTDGVTASGRPRPLVVPPDAWKALNGN
ncbi:LysM peptidoglycan-binding domain-containing protein [Ideonella dechloratans]|uniref:LysM peptidoglycan-binding domain-containing protein n=1 Tax=Ideonella dechloratans TaxID=36863 RepID=UPI0035B25823